MAPFLTWGISAPDSVLTSLSSVSLFDGDRYTKTTDFSLFSVPLKITPAFCRFPRMPFLPLPFSAAYSGVGTLSHFGTICPSQLPSTMARSERCYGVTSPAGGIPFGRSCSFQAALPLDKYSLTKKHGRSRISKRMENSGEKRKFPRL